MLHATHDSVRAQILAILAAWGSPPHLAETTADIMVETDLTGVDSHGISMLMAYEELLTKGQLRIAGEPRVVRDFAATAMVDGADGLGHPAAFMAMKLAVEKARAFGVGAVGVVNSHHFGAAGCYARIASDAGLIGMVTSSTRGILMVPTRAAEPVLGTNPIAFAAPAGTHKPVVLDMATTTVAGNKVKVYHLNDKPLPEGWVQDGEGRPVTDSHVANDYVFKHKEGGITPVGGPESLGGHKGYGLALMAHILGGTLVGASFSPLRNRTQKPTDPNNIGHFMLAVDPRAFRDIEGYENDLDAVIDVLHATRPADPAKPVLVPGEPEEASRAKRLVEGIPMPESLVQHVRDVAAHAGVAYVLKGAG
jgi:LDH2 family malate/lactate/ureidoglycolate dehydrogenase